MATLAFSAVGTALGGPIGGAIGTLVGRQVDTALFGTSRQGARLKELDVTTSSYGQTIPRHFGRMRAAGTMIWATELVEHSETQGSKGSASTTTYSYTANFAVALASRPIQRIGRIWADGKLLRGADGDLKVGGEMRIYTGHGDQPTDPLIAASEGEQRCPAHRGLAYVVFEDLDLTDYYNRIPSLTFEVIADDAFGLQDLMGDGLDQIDADVPLGGIAGYACETALIDDVQTIDQVIPLRIDVAGDRIVIGRERLQDAAIQLPEAAIATDDDSFGAASGYARNRAAPSPQPPTVLRYYDLDRDYQASAQRASGRAAPGEPRTIELPAVLDATTARTLIEQTSRRIDWSRDTVSWRTSELNTKVAPGALVALPGIAGQWVVTQWEWRDGGVELALERVLPTGADVAPQLAADAGRGNSPLDAPPGQTTIIAFEMPMDGEDSGSARQYAAVSSTSSNWSGAALYADRGDGELHPLGGSGRTRAIIGAATSVLPIASPLLFDRGTQLAVTLIDPAMQLASADTRQLAYGANLALVGDEIVQFARASSLGEGRWGLEGLLRGLGGSEAAIGAHVTGEPFVLLSSPLVALDAATLGSDTKRQVLAVGRGDTDPVASSVRLDGLTLRPLAPVHPRRAIRSDGGWTLTWTRRARGVRYWQDGIDTPLVEQSETYIVTLGPLDAPDMLWSVSEAMLDLPTTTLASLSATWPGATLRVRQQGTHALSDPLTLCTIP
ncbi:hypothetical protein WSK_3179 [Novosphingobium sp. Rr 2-17]|uniref:phage tail protein n=1 Tax=Novosphingobium sp. Rr 2-17 TaxID=555793 RepID=UPI0002698568|nr:phage tail protein [Novosphingobium sp. Rr 2-17]EIZ78297.1 hypothetical protein WSK_3179 [Novosphingobium sp. Rr 2-17]